MHVFRLNAGYAKGRARPTREERTRSRERRRERDHLIGRSDSELLHEGETAFGCGGVDPTFETLDLDPHGRNEVVLLPGIVAHMDGRPRLTRGHT